MKELIKLSLYLMYVFDHKRSTKGQTFHQFGQRQIECPTSIRGELQRPKGTACSPAHLDYRFHSGLLHLTRHHILFE